MKLTVILPTHNPRREFIERTLRALEGQSLPREDWELLVIDNASATPLETALVAWHPQGRVVREERLGLTHARLCGIAAARGEVLVWVDDDNILDSRYLELALDAFAQHPQLGAAGGKSSPEYVEAPPAWYRIGLAPLGCRDLGDQRIVSKWDERAPAYPKGSPIGAGMVTRRKAIELWSEAVRGDLQRQALGRTGTALTSGEDNDINLTLARAGWELAYLPELQLTHIIPPGRLTLDYQKRIARVSFRDFIKVLDVHGIRPWQRIAGWTYPLRAAKAWLSLRGWAGPQNAVRWHAALGQLEGRRSLKPR